MAQYRVIDEQGRALAFGAFDGDQAALAWGVDVAGAERVQQWLGVGSVGHWSTVFPCQNA